MATEDIPKRHDEYRLRRGFLRGPSQGLEAWAAFLLAFRKAWRESGPAQKQLRWPLVLGSGLTIIAATTLQLVTHLLS